MARIKRTNRMRLCDTTPLWHCVAMMVVVTSLLLVHPSHASAQRKPHYLFHGRQPAGEIGRAQLQRRPDLLGFFQPVQITVPQGATVSMADGGSFGTEYADTTVVGLQVGSVYRLKVGNIPNRKGEVYPSIELLDRMHPPQGKETRYPIPVEIAPEDIALALQGKFVTRVVYVENPQDAIAARELPEQRYFEVLPHEDPLHVAGELGRPVAIIRMGSVLPKSNQPLDSFLFGSPPFIQHAVTAPRKYVAGPLKPGDTPKTPVKNDVLPDARELPGPKPQGGADEPAERVTPSPSDAPGDNIFDDEPNANDGAVANPLDPPSESTDGDDPFGFGDGETDSSPFDDGGADDATDGF